MNTETKTTILYMENIVCLTNGVIQARRQDNTYRLFLYYSNSLFIAAMVMTAPMTYAKASMPATTAHTHLMLQEMPMS